MRGAPIRLLAGPYAFLRAPPSLSTNVASHHYPTTPPGRAHTLDACSANPADGFYVDVTGSDQDGKAIGCSIQDSGACDTATSVCATKAGNDGTGKAFIELMACAVSAYIPGYFQESGPCRLPRCAGVDRRYIYLTLAPSLSLKLYTIGSCRRLLG